MHIRHREAVSKGRRSSGDNELQFNTLICESGVHFATNVTEMGEFADGAIAGLCWQYFGDDGEWHDCTDPYLVGAEFEGKYIVSRTHVIAREMRMVMRRTGNVSLRSSIYEVEVSDTDVVSDDAFSYIGVTR